jgi:hypothetical protein
MRKKLIQLALVLGVATATLNLVPSAASACQPETHCCADGRCVTCCHCAIRCTV